MTVELFDLAQRLHAQVTGVPAPRMAYAPVVRGAGDPIAMTLAPRGGRPGLRFVQGERDIHVRAADAGSALSDLGVAPTVGAPTLIVAGSLALRELGRQKFGDPGVEMVVRWWRQQAEFPVSASVVDVVRACARRWVCGTGPDHDHDLATWLDWLGIAATGAPALLDVYARVSAGTPLPVLEVMARGEAFAWDADVTRFAEGRSTVVPRSAAGRELSLLCDATDLLESGMFADPLVRARRVHSGDVIPGTLVQPPQPPQPAQGSSKRPRIERHVIACDRLDCRLRAGQAVVGWVGAPDGDTSRRAFSGTVDCVTNVNGGLTLVVKTGAASLAAGTRVSVMAAPVIAGTQARGRQSAENLRRHGSWLTTGRPPQRVQRDVPLEVVFHAAEET